MAVQRHNDELLKTLEPGDLVEIPRTVYSHWAVYTGHEMVVHRGVDDKMTSSFLSKGSVRMDDFHEVTDGHKAYKNNSVDRTHRPRERGDIVRHAVARVGEHGYNLLFNNCEHFATSSRNGKSSSTQVKNLLGGLAVAAGVVTARVVSPRVVASIPYLTHPKKEKKEVKEEKEEEEKEEGEEEEETI